MSQKNDTTILILALLITVGLAGGGFWWFRRSQLPPNSQPTTSESYNSNSPNTNSTEPVKTFAQVQNIPTALVSYGGSTTWAPLRQEVDGLIQVVWPEFKLRYTQHPTKPPGSGTGIKMLLNDQLAFAQSSRPIKETEYQQAQQKGFTLKQIPVAIDGIAVAVNPDLNIPGLTITQLKQIYTGEITNWYQLGGPDVPIVAYSRRPEASGTIEFFVENILNGAELGSNVEFIPTTTQALRQVTANLGAIYYASAPEVVPQCKIKPLPIGRESTELVSPYQKPWIPPENCPNQRNQLNAAAFQNSDYPLTRRLFVIIKENGQVDQQVGEAYARLLLTDQGQDLIEKAGFVKLR
jgi:phosphate transport system substrate-binding protein